MSNYNKFSGFLFLLVMLSSCCSTKPEYLSFNGLKYISVTSLGASKDGKKDASSKIQAALNTRENVYFPRGDYLISKSYSGRHNPQALLINDRSKVRNILFEEGARLVIIEDKEFITEKASILKIYTEYGDINELNIDGLTIYADKNRVTKRLTGLFAVENNGHQIKKLVVKNSSFINLNGTGINTYASYNEFSNIYTENIGTHGIGASNPYNLGEEHHLYIDGYTSLNDRGYSIDFSGAVDRKNKKYANPNDSWTGIAKNIYSRNSKRGIKTAGYWNLTLENVEVINSEYYGFFINKDAPGKTITLKNYVVKGSGDVGFSLSGKTMIKGDSIKIIDCGGGLNIIGTQYDLSNIEVRGNGSMKFGMRLSNSGTIDNFSCSGTKDEYAPIWVSGENVRLSNGRVFNNKAPYGIMVHESPIDVEISKMYFDYGTQKRVIDHDILVLQKEGKLKIESTDDQKPIKINNKSNIKILNEKSSTNK